jgi:hypothetical protein
VQRIEPIEYSLQILEDGPMYFNCGIADTMVRYHANPMKGKCLDIGEKNGILLGNKAGISRNRNKNRKRKG